MSLICKPCKAGKSSHSSTKSLSGKPCFLEINTKVLVENSGFYAKFPTLVTWRPSFFAFPSRWHQINPRESNTCFQGTDGRISVNTTSTNHDNLAQDVSTQSTLTALTVRAWLIQASSSCHTWLEALKMLTGHNAPLNQPATKEVSSVTSVASTPNEERRKERDRKSLQGNDMLYL